MLSMQTAVLSLFHPWRLFFFSFEHNMKHWALSAALLGSNTISQHFKSFPFVLLCLPGKMETIELSRNYKPRLSGIPDGLDQSLKVFERFRTVFTFWTQVCSAAWTTGGRDGGRAPVPSFGISVTKSCTIFLNEASYASSVFVALCQLGISFLVYTQEYHKRFLSIQWLVV